MKGWNDEMRKMIGKRMLCLLLAAVMLMAGCGKQESIQGQSNEDNSNEQICGNRDRFAGTNERYH